jgi:class 3 adenylate cyclase
MFDEATDTITVNTTDQIRCSKKHVTILFTDIVDSTKYWAKFGDVQGRLMVNRHNRLLFPLVVKFKGRIVKTIGDSIMAVFVKPEQAVEAAVALQQAMALERQGDETFQVYIRIGIHTGDAIVEKEDVYGDIVNVAARIENVGEGNEILVSQSTVAYIEDEFAFIFNRKGWFVPKGKNTKLYVHTCDWKNHPSLIGKIPRTSLLPVSRRQKMELGFFLAATTGVLYFIYLKYIRFLLSDSEHYAPLYLNISGLLETYPYAILAAALTVLFLLILFIRMRLLPLTLMRLIRGGFSFSVGFTIMYLIASYAPVNKVNKWNEVLTGSVYTYVEVLENNSTILAEPSLQGEQLKRIHSGNLFLQTGWQLTGGLTWNKVIFASGKYGWIVQKSPPQMGVAEKIVSREYTFNFRYKDLYAFVAGFAFFIMGFWRFRIKPI